jgi:prepilin-type N-terminal cleavage/methylation domain-containing protein
MWLPVSNAQGRRALTLVELIAALAIVAILSSLVAAAIPRVIESARREKALARAYGLAQALKAYRNVYGRWPGQTQGEEDRTYAADHAALLLALTNNPRRIVFLDAPETVSVAGQCLDPWGRPFVIAMDEDGDGVTAVAATNAGATLAATASDTAAIASWGPAPAVASRRILTWAR